MYYRLIAGLIFLTCINIKSYSQDPVDSLENELTQVSGVERIEILNTLSDFLTYENLGRSRKYALSALSLSDSLSYIQGRGHALKNLGLIAFLEADFVSAIDYLQEALSAGQTTQDLPLLKTVYYLLARTYEETKALDKSLDNYRKNHNMARDLNKRTDMALALLGMGKVNNQMGRISEAVENTRDALDIFIDQGNKHGQAQAYIQMGRFGYQKNRSAQARQFFNQAREIAEDLRDISLLFTINKSLADFYRSSHIDSTIHYLNHAFYLAGQMKRPFLQKELILDLSDQYVKKGEFDKAFRYNQQYHQINDSLLRSGKSGIASSQTGKRMTLLDDSLIDAAISNEVFEEDDKKINSTLLYIIAGCVFLLFFLILFLLNKYRFQKKSLANINKLENDIQVLTAELQNKELKILAAKETESTLKKQNQTLRQMISGKEDEGSPIDQIQEISRKVAENTRGDIVSVWIYNKEEHKIYCFDEYQIEKDIHRSGGEFNIQEFPLYFEALTHMPLIDADKCRQDPRTMEFLQPRLVSREIFSKLDTPLKFNNHLKGILWVERTGHVKEWTDQDKKFVLAVAEMLGQIIASKIIPEKNESSEKSFTLDQQFLDGLDRDHNSIYLMRDYNDRVTYSLGDIKSVLNVSLSEIIDTEWAMEVTKEDRGKYSEYFNRLIEEDIPGEPVIYGIKNRDGSVSLVSERLISILDYNNSKQFLFQIQPYTDGRDHGDRESGLPEDIKGEDNQMEETEVEIDDLENFYKHLDRKKTQYLNSVYNNFLVGLYHRLAQRPLKYELIMDDFFIGEDNTETGKEEINLVEIFSDVVSIFKNEYPDISFHDETESKTICFNNKGLMYGLMYILLENSIESIKNDGDIYLFSDIRKEILTIKIIDTGTGVRTEYKDKIFKPFFTTKDPDIYNGLGLAVARKIVKINQGKIKARSKFQKGLELIIEIPVVNSKN